MKIRVYYEDTDAGGVVYHTKYLSFCERARSELFFRKGIKFENGSFVVRAVEATFFSPARLGDVVEVKTKIDSIKKAILKVTQSIYRDDKLLFEAKIKLVYLKEWKIATIPEKCIKILNELA